MLIRCEECGRIDWGRTLYHWRSYLFSARYRRMWRRFEASRKKWERMMERSPIPPGTGATIDIPHLEALIAKDLGE